MGPSFGITTFLWLVRFLGSVAEKGMISTRIIPPDGLTLCNAGEDRPSPSPAGQFIAEGDGQNAVSFDLAVYDGSGLRQLRFRGLAPRPHSVT